MGSIVLEDTCIKKYSNTLFFPLSELFLYFKSGGKDRNYSSHHYFTNLTFTKRKRNVVYLGGR